MNIEPNNNAQRAAKLLVDEAKRYARKNGVRMPEHFAVFLQEKAASMFAAQEFAEKLDKLVKE